MALNPFFSQGLSSEQNLVQDLINEQLKIYGIDGVDGKDGVSVVDANDPIKKLGWEDGEEDV